MQSMSLGRVFFRDLNHIRNDKKQFVFTGKIWVPSDANIKGEHLYLVVGSEQPIEGQASLSLMMMLESPQDMTEVTKKKDLNKVLPLIESPY